MPSEASDTGFTKDLLSEEFDSPPLISPNMISKIINDKDFTDLEFDSILPPLHRFLSPVQWTSLTVARKIAEWLADYKNKKFIDIGSGIGKLGLLLRILTDLEVYGIEQRSRLVQVAQKIVQVNSFDRIHFSTQNLLELNWADYDIYYLYNPFQEHVCHSDIFLIDDSIPLQKSLFSAYLNKVYEELRAAPPGKVLITFHGYGGSVPRAWTLKHSDFIENGFLSMWVKTRG